MAEEVEQSVNQEVAPPTESEQQDVLQDTPTVAQDQ